MTVVITSSIVTATSSDTRPAILYLVAEDTWGALRDAAHVCGFLVVVVDVFEVEGVDVAWDVAGWVVSMRSTVVCAPPRLHVASRSSHLTTHHGRERIRVKWEKKLESRIIERGTDDAKEERILPQASKKDINK